MRSGYVSIIGKSNVGKSTLLNNLVSMHLAITSDKSGTTRNIIEGVYEDNDTQIVFVDTPGINKPKDKISSILNRKSYSIIEGVDLILFMIDGSKGVNKADEVILEKLKDIDIPVILIINKVDKVNKDNLLEDISKYKDLYNFSEIYPLSALKDNLNKLIDTIKKYLNEQDKIFIDNTITNISTDFYISEIIREKVLRKTRDEVPHSVTCLVEKREEKKNAIIINAVIIVERESHKRIIVGSKGSMLKSIGTDARNDLEEYFGKKVYLELFVKVIENWKEKDKYLKELGIDDLDNFE